MISKNNNKMFIIAIILMISAVESKEYKFAESKREYHIPIINLSGVNNHVVHFKKDHTDHVLIDQIMARLNKDNSVIIVTDDLHYRDVTSNLDASILIVTNSLDIVDFENKTFSQLFKSAWSPVSIVFTTTENNVCEDNRVRSEEMLKRIKKYVNTLWLQFYIARVLVSLPYICPNLYVIFDGKEWSHKVSMYSRHISVIKTNDTDELYGALKESGNSRYLAVGFPIRAHIFFRYPTSIFQCDIVHHYTGIDFGPYTGMCGMDGVVMHDYMDYFKFKMELVNDGTCNQYGYLQSSNITTGSLGCIVRNITDISFNSRFLVSYIADQILYLHYIMKDHLCIIMKAPGTVPLWHFAHNIFASASWLTYFVSYIFLGVFSWVIAKATLNKVMPVHQYIINSIVSSTFGFPLYKEHKFLILKSISFASCILFLAKYQGYINYQFTTITSYQECKTLKDFYESSTVLYVSPSIAKLLELSSTRKTYPGDWEINSRVVIRENTSTEHVTKDKSTATLGRYNDAILEWLVNHPEEKTYSSIYLVEECLRSYLLSYIARPGFIFTEDSRIFIMRLLEAGLPEMYFIWTKRTVTMAIHYKNFSPRPRPYKPINLEKIRTAFAILGLGYVVTIVVFILEKRKGCRRINAESSGEMRYID